MSKTLKFTADEVGQNRMRFIHQALSVSPLVSQLDETATRRYVALMAKLDEVSVPDPMGDPGNPLAYWPRITDSEWIVEIGADEARLIGECLWSLPWQGYHRHHVVDAVDWVRAPG